MTSLCWIVVVTSKVHEVISFCKHLKRLFSGLYSPSEIFDLSLNNEHKEEAA